MTHAAAVVKTPKTCPFPGQRWQRYLWDKDEAVDRGCTHEDASGGKTKQQVVPSAEETVN